MSLLSNRFIELIKDKYMNGHIYSLVGKVLVAINPYEPISDLYSEKTIREYNENFDINLAPHIYLIANEAINMMRTFRRSQSIITLGETGAGKTESTKEILKYLCFMTSNGIDNRINQSNFILEAFGNAQTQLNDNSSRYVKLVQLNYNLEFGVIGGKVENFMLEKSRIDTLEFHIFRIIFGASHEIRTQLYLTEELFKECFGTTMEENDRSSDFQRFNVALDTFNMSKEQKCNLYKLIAGMLYLSLIKFEYSKDGATVSETSKRAVQIGSTLLSIDSDELIQALTIKKIEIGNKESDKISIPMDLITSQRTKGILMKSLFVNIRNQLISKINKIIECENSQFNISILDTPGFECFSNNSLEQLCINFANEKFQQFSMNRLMKRWEHDYADSFLIRNAIDLIGGEMGIFDMLDDESKVPLPSIEKFTSNVINTCKSNKTLLTLPNADTNESFLIRHFAADVCYDTKYFLEKNIETVTSSIALLSDKILRLCIDDGATWILGPKNRKFTSECFDFRRQLNTLLGTLEKCDTNFIRCIKPNADKASKHFDDALVASQLRYSGTLLIIQNADSILKLGETTEYSSISGLEVTNEISKSASKAKRMKYGDENDSMAHNNGGDHLPDFDEKKSSSRCRLCKKTTHVICLGCNAHLCFVKERNCFKNYHLMKDTMKK